MPRKPTSKVETVRFELGTWERTHLDGVLQAQALDKYSEALTQFLSLEKMYVLITLLELATGREILWGTPNDLMDLVTQVKDWWKNTKEEYGEGGFLGFINESMGWGRELSPEQQESIRQTGELWANAFGTTLEGGEYTPPSYSSPGDVWASAYGLNIEDYL